MGIRFEEQVNFFEVYDSSGDYIGDLHCSCAKWMFIGQMGEEIGANTLRQIAEKLDELNKGK
jgi:hypothetical protein